MNIPAHIPIYEYIKQEMRSQIENGILKPGARVSSEFELARDYGVSRNPTRQALRDLELEGYLVRLPGRGSFVAPVERWQKLKFGEIKTIAVACPFLDSSHWRNVLKGFVDYADEKEFHVLAHHMQLDHGLTGRAAHDYVSFLATLKNSGVQGIAMSVPPGQRTLDLLNNFQQTQFPFVLIDDYVREIDADFVANDFGELAYSLTRAMTSRGHQSIGAVVSGAIGATVEDFVNGYRRALEEDKCPFDEELIGMLINGNDNNQELTRMMAFRRRPTAIICADAASASSIVQQLPPLGYRIPDDIEIALIDDDDFAGRFSFPVLTATRSALMLGRECALALLDRLVKPSAPPQQLFLKGRINTETAAHPKGLAHQEKRLDCCHPHTETACRG